MVWSLSLPSLPFPCFFCMAISATGHTTITLLLGGKKKSYSVLGLSHWPEKHTWGWGTCQLITKWSFYFLFVSVPCMCKTAARRWTGWAEQDSSHPWSSHQIPANAQGPATVSLVHLEMRVREFGRKMTRSHGRALQVKKSHLRCLNKTAAVLRGAEVWTTACWPANETPSVSKRSFPLRVCRADWIPVRRAMQDSWPSVSKGEDASGIF